MSAHLFFGQCFCLMRSLRISVLEWRQIEPQRPQLLLDGTNKLQCTRERMTDDSTAKRLDKKYTKQCRLDKKRLDKKYTKQCQGKGQTSSVLLFQPCLRQSLLRQPEHLRRFHFAGCRCTQRKEHALFKHANVAPISPL